MTTIDLDEDEIHELITFIDMNSDTIRLCELPHDHIMWPENCDGYNPQEAKALDSAYNKLEAHNPLPGHNQ